MQRSHLLRVHLALRGLACDSCNKAVLRALRRVLGVSRVLIRYAAGEALVDYDPTRTGLTPLLDAPTKAGGRATT